jgi:1-acyl-sn-glycerol-3-phosphate acyltransferase
MPDVAWRFLRTGSGLLARRRLDLTVEGAGNLPRRGPMIVAARHFHHLYDGVALMATVPRPLHILVGLDWVRNPAGKAAMTALCRAAGWPVVLRRDGPGAVDDRDARRALRRATADSLDLLAAGHALLVFPEGYPNIDPGYTPKWGDDAFLPFQPGFAGLAALAAGRGLDVPIVPAGFAYTRGERWRVTLRFGEPLTIDRAGSARAVIADVEREVRRLSGLPEPPDRR